MDNNPWPGLTKTNQVILASSLVATQNALRTTLIELYRLKGPNGPAWLNRFEQQVLSDVKGSVAEGVSMEDELKTVEGTLAMIRFVFTAVRSQIADQANSK